MGSKRIIILYSNTQDIRLEKNIMNRKKKKRVFPIEKKLADIEWKLELLKASVVTTHTPLRTIKSMVQADITLPTQNLLQKIIYSPLSQRKTLTKILHL
jgi:hypothetical protein